MNALNFSTGIKTFDVNEGSAQISYNPTDVNFVSTLYDLFVACSERYEADKDKKFENILHFSNTQNSAIRKCVRELTLCLAKVLLLQFFRASVPTLWRTAFLCGQTSCWLSLIRCRRK